MPIELRVTLAAFFLMMGGVSVYERLRRRPEDAGNGSKKAGEAAGRSGLLVRLVTITYFTVALTVIAALPENAMRWGETFGKYAGGLAAEWFVRTGVIGMDAADAEVGPIAPRFSGWGWLPGLLPLLFVAGIYSAAWLEKKGRLRAAAGLAGTCFVLSVAVIPASMWGLRLGTGLLYGEELQAWLDKTPAVQPDKDLWGKEGPVVIQGYADQYREIEPETGIIYRRWSTISDVGEPVQSESIYPFRMGPFTIDVSVGKEYRVVGAATGDKMIVATEKLRVAGYLSGGAIVPTGNMPIVIMPASLGEWRKTTAETWVKRPGWVRALMLAFSVYDLYAAAIFLALGIVLGARAARNDVKSNGEEAGECTEQPKA
ncbi:MAG TPA: hypothetical protein ENN09_02085 [Planctomycetes bacterium]|nr:hypothetical protein [Planctomycetota bacterium]